MSVVGYIVEDSSLENESGVGHQRNELTILKTFLCFVSNGLKFMKDLCVCVCVRACVCVRVCVCVCVCVHFV